MGSKIALWRLRAVSMDPVAVQEPVRRIVKLGGVTVVPLPKPPATRTVSIEQQVAVCSNELSVGPGRDPGAGGRIVEFGGGQDDGHDHCHYRPPRPGRGHWTARSPCDDYETGAWYQ